MLAGNKRGVLFMFLLWMFFAHLVGDYVVQGDRIAAWKARSVAGVMVHGIIVSIVTVGCAFLFGTDSEYLYAAAAIGAIHTIIDLLNFIIRKRLQTKDWIGVLLFFFCDQIAHFFSIMTIAALIGALPTWPEMMLLLQQHRFFTLALAYTFISMPAWVLIEYAVGCILRNGPDFVSASKRKYMMIIERGLIMTFLLAGQLFLVPLIAIPRLIYGCRATSDTPRTICFSEFVASILLTVGVGYTVLQLL